MRRLTAALLAVLLGAAGCGSGDDSSSPEAVPSSTSSSSTPASTTTPAATDPTTTTSLSVDPPPVVYGVGTWTAELVDDTRPTPPHGDAPGQEVRRLPTTVWYPASVDPSEGFVADAEPDPRGGPHPLVVFAHEFTSTPVDVEDVVDAWVAAGFVVAAPTFPLSRADAPGGPTLADLTEQPADLAFVVDQIAENPSVVGLDADIVDTDRVAAVGWGIGGLTVLGATVHACCRTADFDAAIVMATQIAALGEGDYEWDEAPPLLVVHGTADADVAYDRAIDTFNAAVPAKGLISIDGGIDHAGLFAGDKGHEQVRRITTDFLLAHLRSDADAATALAEESTEPGVSLRYAPADGENVTIPTTTLPAADRRVTVEPIEGLLDGSVVTVSWTGFIPGGTVNVVQCSGSGAQFCSIDTGEILLDNPSGSGSVELTIVAGAVGDGSCGPASDKCVVVVEDFGVPDDDAAVATPITFAE